MFSILTDDERTQLERILSKLAASKGSAEVRDAEAATRR